MHLVLSKSPLSLRHSQRTVHFIAPYIPAFGGLTGEKFDARDIAHELDDAVACLAARAHSKHEIEQKLLRVGYRPCTVEMVLYKLEREHLLNDADFARQWVEARSGRKMGRSRIAQELRRKGIDADEAEEALSAIGEDAQLADAIALAEKAAARAKSDENPRKTYQRIAAMLARRGFRWDIAKEALAQVLQAD